MQTSKDVLVNLDFIFDELNVFIPSNPSVRYNLIYLLLDVSKAYLLMVVNDAYNLVGSISEDDFSSLFSSFLSFLDSSAFFFSNSIFLFSYLSY